MWLGPLRVSRRAGRSRRQSCVRCPARRPSPTHLGFVSGAESDNEIKRAFRRGLSGQDRNPRAADQALEWFLKNTQSPTKAKGATRRLCGTAGPARQGWRTRTPDRMIYWRMTAVHPTDRANLFIRRRGGSTSRAHRAVRDNESVHRHRPPPTTGIESRCPSLGPGALCGHAIRAGPGRAGATYLRGRTSFLTLPCAGTNRHVVREKVLPDEGVANHICPSHAFLFARGKAKH